MAGSAWHLINSGAQGAWNKRSKSFCMVVHLTLEVLRDIVNTWDFARYCWSFGMMSPCQQKVTQNHGNPEKLKKKICLTFMISIVPADVRWPSTICVESIVCKMVAILFRPQCVNSPAPYLHDPLPSGQEALPATKDVILDGGNQVVFVDKSQNILDALEAHFCTLDLKQVKKNTSNLLILSSDMWKWSITG